MNDNSAAFIVWNPFQILQFENLVQSLPNSRYILINRGQALDDMKRFIAGGAAAPVEVVSNRMMHLVDGCYDVVFFQSPFPAIEKFNKSHLVSLQYGLAKERHNYGEWRALADMNLMYGDYSAAAASHFAPSYAVGNTKFAQWDFNKYKAEKRATARQLGLDPDLKTILFMPTYGELGSFDALLEPLSRIADDYNVVIKMHHNNERTGKSWQDTAKDVGIRHLFGGDADQLQLLSVADMVVSDFSGAIFDALYAEVPVLLYQARADEVVGFQKFEKTSLEFRRREELGQVCTSADDFLPAVRRTLENGRELVERSSAIREELFTDGRSNDTIALIHERLNDLLHGRVPRLTAGQLVVRDTCRALRRLELENSRLRNKSKKGKSLFRRAASLVGRGN